MDQRVRWRGTTMSAYLERGPTARKLHTKTLSGVRSGSGSTALVFNSYGRENMENIANKS